MQQQQQHSVALPEDRRCEQQRIVFNAPLTDSRTKDQSTRPLEQSSSRVQKLSDASRTRIRTRVGTALHSQPDRQSDSAVPNSCSWAQGKPCDPKRIFLQSAAFVSMATEGPPSMHWPRSLLSKVIACLVPILIKMLIIIMKLDSLIMKVICAEIDSQLQR